MYAEWRLLISSPGLHQPWEVRLNEQITLKALGMYAETPSELKGLLIGLPRVETTLGWTLANAVGVLNFALRSPVKHRIPFTRGSSGR
jgi:hypothetical protein